MAISLDYFESEKTLKCLQCDGVYDLEEWEVVQDAQVTLSMEWDDKEECFVLDYDHDSVNLLDNMEIVCPECYECSKVSHELWIAAFEGHTERQHRETFAAKHRKAKESQ